MTVRTQRSQLYRRTNPKQVLGNSEYASFEQALMKVLSVPHLEMKSKIGAEKKTRAKDLIERTSRQ